MKVTVLPAKVEDIAKKVVDAAYTVHKALGRDCLKG